MSRDHVKSQVAAQTWQVYGLSFSSQHVFQTPLHPSPSAPDLVFNFQKRPAWSDTKWEGAEAVASSPTAGDVQVVVRRSGDEFCLKLGDWASYVIQPGKISGYVQTSDFLIIAELRFLDTALPLYLELLNTPVLHASAVELEGKVIAFTAYAGGGKSSLAAGMTKRGARFMADDVVALTRLASVYWVSPGYPQLRLWPDAAAELIGPEGHQLIHPSWQKRRATVEGWGGFSAKPGPLGLIYLVDCREEHRRVNISVPRGHNKLMKMLYNSPAIPALSIRTQLDRMKFFSDLISNVPVRVLSYPRRYEMIPEVLDTLTEDALVG